jgi:acetyl esterase
MRTQSHRLAVHATSNRLRGPVSMVCAVVAVAALFVSSVNIAPASARSAMLWETVTYSQPDGVSLEGDVWSPGPLHPHRTYDAVVVVHGGGFTSNDRSKVTPLAQWLASSGLVAMTIDYRLAPQWLYPSPEEDISAAVDWLRSQTFVSAVGMLGVSTGAILTDWAAAQGIVDRAVAWSGAGSYDPALIGDHAAQTAIEPHLGCSFDACPDLWVSAAPIASVAPGDPPLLQVHSVRDPILDVASARGMVDAYTAQGNPVTYDEQPNSLHGGAFFNDPTVRDETLTFLQSMAGPLP